MKKIVFLPLVLFVCISYGQMKTYDLPKDVKKILFLGNSITYAGHYVNYLEAYFILKYPERKIEFINLGLPSETVSGLSEDNHADGRFERPKLQDRLKKTIKAIKPDLIFSCYGINDGIYLPFDEKIFSKYKEGINWLDSKVKKEGIELVHITPTIYDKDGGEAYANVMDIYSDWLMSNVYTKYWNVIDIHTPLKQKIADNRFYNPYYKFALDGVHPNKEGHWLIANQILIALGELQRLDSSDKSCFDTFKNGFEVLELVERKQVIVKDAWLTYIGHKRPDMKLGTSLNKAETDNKVIEAQIQLLLE